MEASIRTHPTLITSNSIDPLTINIKHKLLKKGISPTPKILHILRKKELQKSTRKSKRLQSQSPPTHINSSSEKLYFQTICKEYKDFNKTLILNSNLKGRKPWEQSKEAKLWDLPTGFDQKGENISGFLNSDHLRELGLIFQQRKIGSLSMFLDDDDVDVEFDEVMFENGGPTKLPVDEVDTIGILVDRLSAASEMTMKDWKFSKIMKHSGLRFMEGQMLRILQGLGDRGSWKQAMEVVEWVYSKKEHSHYKSRFVYTKLLAVLGKARRPHEALQIFRKMLGDQHIYPDMAAYHSIAVTLGQAGMVRELMVIIECMKVKPSNTIKNMQRNNWDPSLQPDLVIFNSVLNACVSSRQWKAVSWVFEQLRKGGLKANSATYGLAMEVMLNSEKYDTVHELFLKMKRSGNSTKALTYKVLVKTFWKEGKADKAIRIVRDMEQRGIIGSASVYYELACCLCNNGRWQEAMIEIEKLKKLRLSKPLAVTFTGMILSALDGGHVNGCVSIFEHMQNHCAPNIGTVNAMLKVYGRNDMFLEAKELFEKVKRSATGYSACLDDDDTPLIPDAYTYGSMLEASGRAQQWEYFEYVYKEMCIYGYHLDQDKHAALLVEASRAGKWHLLEHAFDTTLEAEEIPHPLLFSGMVIQATFYCDYDKAALIVGAMVHAPFQMNMKDWICLFEKNKDIIGDEHLKKLSDALGHCEMSEKSSASELLKALHAICSCAPSTSVNQSLPIDRVPQCRSNDGKDGVKESDGFSLDLDYDTEDEDDTDNPFNSLPDFVDYDSSADLPDGDFDEEPTEEGDSEVNECNELESPSGEEILRIWKQMRKESGAKFLV